MENNRRMIGYSGLWEKLDQTALQEFAFMTWAVWKGANEVIHDGNTKPEDRVALFVKHYI